MSDNFYFPNSITIYEILFELILEKYDDFRTDSTFFTFKVKDTDIRFCFNISNEYVNSIDKTMFNELLKSYYMEFKSQLKNLLFNQKHYEYCTPELIIEKYFESYIYRKNNGIPSTFNGLLKNPNIICGRRKGHKSSLISLLNNNVYENIFKDTCIVFSTYGEKVTFLSKLNEETYIKYRNNVVSHINETRGRRFSFYIFNNLSNMRSNVLDYLYTPSSRNSHFIVLGN